MKILAFSIVCFASVILADDFKTIDGKEYKNATVTRVEPDGIVLMTSAGISKVYFTEVPKDVQERFHYDPARAGAYAAQQAAAYTRQQTAAQAAEEANKRLKAAAADHQQAQAAAQQTQQGTMSALTARLQELQQQEDNLLVQIGRAEQAQRDARHIRKRNPYYSDPLELQLPLLQSHLNDVRRDKNGTKKQLERAQR